MRGSALKRYPIASDIVQKFNIPTMSDRIIAGAYVIRNRKTSTVLHIEEVGKCELLAYRQDESVYQNQQIWWIEPFPDYEDHEPEKGLVYSITNPGTGMSLDMSPAKGAITPPQLVCGTLII